MKYAEVILPLPLENTYTYRIPSDIETEVVRGSRVIVHFGKKRFYTGIVINVSEREPEVGCDIKEIYSLLDATPILRRPQLRFWEWISTYYLCKLGEVYKAAIPSGLKLESETVVSLNPDFVAETQLKPAEASVLDAFGNDKELTISVLEKRTGLRNVVPVISSLVEKGAVDLSEELRKGFSPKTEVYIRLAESWESEEELQEAFAALKHAKNQERLLLAYLDLSHALTPERRTEVSRKELLERSGCKITSLSGLLRRGILESYAKEVSRLQIHVCKPQELSPLSDAQEKAYRQILDVYKQKDICLLYGVTSSEKTELYIHLIRDILEQGRQVLYLLPEIAITTQITERLARLFGDKLLVYHSRFSDNERVEIWNRLLKENGPCVVLGVRSSIFLPFRDLGLIIVDEEHEINYKQQEPAPRYNARNAALVLANMHGGKALLGSATPSIDSYFNALTGKYGLVELTVRYNEGLLPEIQTVNVSELRRKKQMKDTLFSPLLVEQMRKALAAGEQIILFQNRRGFAPMMECRACGWVPRCAHCDVSLTYHKHLHHLTCHYCGYTIRLPEVCPSCHGTDFRMMGFGTEKVEEEIAKLFPNTRVERLDFDSAKTRKAYERILHDFERGRTQILIGTQMVSKGLDFGNVSVVGILNADSLMNIPDFRAHERAYQLMVQVSGRAGRRDKRGLVILQTSQPEHPLIQMVQRFSYKEMVDWQLSERSMFRYPPYYRLIVLVLRSRNEQLLQNLSRDHAERLRKQLGERVLGPVTPPITYMQTLFIRKIILKLEITAAIAPIRSLLEQVEQEMKLNPAFRQIILHYDVDPL